MQISIKTAYFSCLYAFEYNFVGPPITLVKSESVIFACVTQV